MKFKTFPGDDNNWRITWLGDLDRGTWERSMTEVRLTLHPLSNPTGPRFKNTSVELDSPFNTRLSIGHLPILRIGSVWRAQHAVSNDIVVADQSVLDVLSPEYPEFASASELIYPSDYKIGGALYKTPCLVLNNVKVLTSRTKKNYESKYIKLIIPCQEIARFYFGTSSTLIRRLIHGVSTDLNELIVLESSQTGVTRTGVTPDGELYITLRKQILDSDAWVISRILKDRIARREADQLYLNLMTASMNKTPLYIKMSLPFEGRSNLKCNGLWIKTANYSELAYLALNIVSCTARFPFNGLIIDRENSNRVIKPLGTKTVGYPIPTLKPAEHGEIQTGFGKEPSTNFLLTTLKDQEKRFLDLVGKPIIKRHKLEAKYKAKRIVVSTGDVDGYETGEGDPRNIKLAPIEISIDAVNTDNDQVRLQASMILLWRALRVLRKRYNYNCSVIVTDDEERTPEYKVSHFPMTTKWAIISDVEAKRGRQALWLELEKNGIWSYVVEWERKGTEKFAIYLLQLNNGMHASAEELKQLMDEWANSTGSERKCAGVNRGWKRQSIPHPKSEYTDAQVPDIIARRIYQRFVQS